MKFPKILKKSMPILLILLGSYATKASPNAYFVNGYWKIKSDQNSYEKLIRIKNDSGFYCILDNKSSFRFKVIGDSKTTPMNGKDLISWWPGSGDIGISGEEKGVPYHYRFSLIDSATYTSFCKEEESRFSATTRIISKPHAKNIYGNKRAGRNILGKIMVRSKHQNIQP